MGLLSFLKCILPEGREASELDSPFQGVQEFIGQRLKSRAGASCGCASQNRLRPGRRGNTKQQNITITHTLSPHLMEVVLICYILTFCRIVFRWFLNISFSTADRIFEMKWSDKS